MKRAFHPEDVVNLTTQKFQLPGVFLASAGDFSRSSTVIQDRTATYVDELIPAPKNKSASPFLNYEFEDVEEDGGMTTKGQRQQYTFSEIVDEEDSELLENYLTDELIGKLVDSGQFRMAILSVILLNTLTVGLQTSNAFEKRFGFLMNVLDNVFLTIFIIELCLKLFHGFFLFWKVGWNVFDFFIVAVAVFGDSVSFLSSGRVLRLVRVFRAFRTLRGISSLQGLQMVVQTVLHSLPDMLNIILLLVIIMFIFTVLGITLFGQTVPEYFGTLPKTAFTLFVLLTQDGWVDRFHVLETKDPENMVIGAVYFVCFIIIGAFMFVNMIVGVTVTNLQRAYDELKKEKKAKTRELKRKIGKAASAPVEIVDTTHIPSDHWRAQLPHELPDMRHISIQALENYLLVLVAMEDNLLEYQKLKDELEQVFVDVVGLNEALDASDGESDLSDSDHSDEEAPQGGDALSQLIRAQEKK